MPESYLKNGAKFGFFGKLPINGDFIHRHLPNNFILTWDNWLQENLIACQDQFKDKWLQHYLTSPIWRYFIAPSVLDSNAYIGILAPSVDSVGRYFPMTIACPIPANKASPIFSAAFQSIYANLESIFLKYLHAETGDINMLCDDLDIQNTMLNEQIKKQSIDELPDTFDSHQFILSDQSDISGALSSLWMMQLMAQRNGTTLWWSNGSQAVKPSLLVNKGLPSKQQFIAMLSGFENSEHWRQKHLAIPLVSPVMSEPELAGVEAAIETDNLTEENAHYAAQSTAQMPIQELEDNQLTQPFRPAIELEGAKESASFINNDSAITSHEILSTIGGSAPLDEQPNTHTALSANAFSVCHIGNKRSENQDAILLHDNQALWVVADGMGGHSSGDKASRAIVKQLSEIAVKGDLFANIEQVKLVLQKVNREILEFAKDQRTTCGSTVVLLIQNQNECAFLWAGDSRLYLNRHSQITQLTKDHSVHNLYEESGLPTENIQNNAITRAVGVYDDLEIECGYHELQAGDHFLLCSDGLYETLSEAQINVALSMTSPQDAADNLTNLVLSGPAKDNLSGIFIWY
jgi:type VI secretion system ImpM family protein